MSIVQWQSMKIERDRKSVQEYRIFRHGLLVHGLFVEMSSRFWTALQSLEWELFA